MQRAERGGVLRLPPMREAHRSENRRAETAVVDLAGEDKRPLVTLPAGGGLAFKIEDGPDAIEAERDQPRSP